MQCKGVGIGFKLCDPDTPCTLISRYERPDQCVSRTSTQGRSENGYRVGSWLNGNPKLKKTTSAPVGLDTVMLGPCHQDRGLGSTG